MMFKNIQKFPRRREKNNTYAKERLDENADGIWRTAAQSRVRYFRIPVLTLVYSLLRVVKFQLMYSDPNRASKVNESYFTSSTTPVSFHD